MFTYLLLTYLLTYLLSDYYSSNFSFFLHLKNVLLQHNHAFFCYVETNMYVGPPYCRAEMYAGRVFSHR